MTESRIPILIDTDANNELDDQHAMAYACFNRDVFDIVGVTVNNTPRGDGIVGQYAEAERVLKLCNCIDEIPLKSGVEGNLTDVLSDLDNPMHDGHAAVDFIVEQARNRQTEKLVVIAIGKLTNVALALAKDPTIVDCTRLVWLGSNYPYSGEYNLWSDPDSVNSVIDSGVEFEIVVVRYKETTGATAVAIDGREITTQMQGQGPRVPPVEGRHSGQFETFGDYSISLFENVGLSLRPLFDVVAVAVVKEPLWGNFEMIPAPRLKGVEWEQQSATDHKIGLWSQFNRDAIIEDFIRSVRTAR